MLSTFNKRIMEISQKTVNHVVRTLADRYNFNYDEAMQFLNDESSEVQQHGFTWEKELITNVYGATNDELTKIKYTSKMDLPASLNKLGGYDLSVKTCGEKNAVCMADCLRIFDAVNSNKPFHMTTIFYRQNDELHTKNVLRIIEVDLTNSRKELFGTLEREDIVKLNEAVKLVPHKQKPTPEQHTHMYAIRDSLAENCGHLHLDIKCNSTQSRLQCSFNRFNLFLEKYPERIIEKSDSHHFRGGTISHSIPSGRRKFKK